MFIRLLVPGIAVYLYVHYLPQVCLEMADLLDKFSVLSNLKPPRQGPCNVCWEFPRWAENLDIEA